MPATSGILRRADPPERTTVVVRPVRALVRRGTLDARTRTIAFAYLFAAVAYINPATYTSAYPTLSSRLPLADSFAHNKAVVLFYGKAYDLLTAGGYSAWRTGGTLALFAAVFGLFAAVRAMRTEEDSGRAELVLAGLVGRRTVFASSLLAIAAGIAVLWLAEFAGLVLAGLPAGASAYLALATASVALVFAGVGALISQLAPTRRGALQSGLAVFAIAFLLRVIADTAGGGQWLRWATPLGWAEELRPFTGAQPLVLLLPLALSTALLAAAASIAAGRDIGAGLLPARDSAAPRLHLLSSPTAHALRQERGSLTTWISGVAAFGLIIGIVSESVNGSVISDRLQKQLEKFGAGPVVTPRDYVAFAFIFFVLVTSLFACSQLGAARREEEQERLETLFALPVGRRQWLLGRLGLAAAGAVAISLTAGATTWFGAQAAGVDLSFTRLLEAGGNCLPVSLLFLGLATLAYALVPRASSGIAYGLVTIAFLWHLFGSLVGAPRWVVAATPFEHVAAVPVQSFRAAAAAIMIATGLVAAAAGVAWFERRDVLGA
ncbi:MAG TPA: ABC transporter permease subunit [Solirubrobacteraceae bacterium]|nr:ABC transporter permease subunit [Solirubrobacteraceae bacterium]